MSNVNFEDILDESSDDELDMEIEEADERIEEEDEDEDEYDREVNNILDDIEDVMELNNEEEVNNEIRVLVDSDYNSDCSEDYNEDLQLNDKQVRYLKQADINNMDQLQKMCSISFYYRKNNDKFCAECFLRLSDMFLHARAVRKHETAKYVFLVGGTCCECRCSLYQILPCNLCPICVVTQ